MQNSETVGQNARDAGWSVREQLGSWVVLCRDGSDECRVLQRQTIDQGGVSKLLAEFVFVKSEPDPILVVTLPFGADFRPGIIVRVDEGEEYRGEFVTCSEQGCRAVLTVGAELQAALASGNVLRLGMRPYGTTQTAAIEAPLDGSAAALRYVFP